MDIELGELELTVDDATFKLVDGGITDIINFQEYRSKGDLKALVGMFMENLTSISGVNIAGKEITLQEFKVAKLPIVTIQKLLGAYANKLTEVMTSSIQVDGQAEKNGESPSASNGVSTTHA